MREILIEDFGGRLAEVEGGLDEIYLRLLIVTECPEWCVH